MLATLAGAVLFAAQATAETWDAQLAVTTTGGGQHQGVEYPSSSALSVRWTVPAGVPVAYFEVRAEEKQSRVTARAAADAVELVVSGLKAATSYRVAIRACLDEACESYLEGSESAADTPPEYWRIAGTGASFRTADRIVADGNIGSHAFRYGPWAGPENDGRVQLYYTPLQREEKGVKIGEQVNADPAADPLEAALRFRGVSGYGLMRMCGELSGPNAPPAPPECVNPQGIASGVQLFQAVPLARTEDGGGGKVRLYFEGPGRGLRTRILYLDSQDGYEGRDFHRGAATRCDTAADYGPGGGCEPALAIGVDVDGPESGNPNVRNARQFKIGYPTAESFAWDQAPGTFMWFTTEWNDGRCSRFGFNAAYAVWTGTKWEVQYAESGCPKILGGVQAPAPVHLGGTPGPARYKMYFSRHALPGGPTDPRIAAKPVELLYADPETAGDPARTDFEDWEPLDSARNVRFLWPDGTELTADEESRLDDFVVLAPTADPKRLVMYSNMSFTGLNAVPFIGAAILVNP